MTILALEFSTVRRSAALLNGIHVIRQESEEAKRGGSPFPLLARVLGDTRPEQIEGIAIGLGPGSYTGIRSSLAIAQGWNLAHGTPSAGISSADAIAFLARQNGLRGNVEVVIDAQRNEIYSTGYSISDHDLQTIKPLEILSKPSGCGVRIGVDGSEAIYPTAVAIGILAAKKGFGPPENLEAIYLREPSFLKAPAPKVF